MVGARSRAVVHTYGRQSHINKGPWRNAIEVGQLYRSLVNKLLQLVGSLVGLDPHSTPESDQKRKLRIKITTGAAFVVGISVVVVAIVITFISQQHSRSVPVDLTIRPTSVAEENFSTVGLVIVDVVGAVPQPGIYELSQGSRVVDAVMAAGGIRDGEAACGLNMARVLKDGEQIAVLTADENCGSVQGGAESGKISVNASSAEALDALPGIGPAIAQRIIALRVERGGFSSIEELRDVSGIGDKLFAGIEELLTL